MRHTFDADLGCYIAQTYYYFTERTHKMREKLTVKVIEKLAHRGAGKAELVWDQIVPGLILSVSAAGSLRYVVQYSVDGKQRRATLPTRPWLGDPAQAERHLAQARAEALTQQATGQDILAARDTTAPDWRRRKAAGMADDGSLTSKFAAFIQTRQFLNNSATHQARVIRRMESQVLPVLGHMRVEDITREDVQKLHDELAVPQKVGTGRKGGPFAALQAINALGTTLAWALPEGRVSPCSKAETARITERDFLFTPEEFERVVTYLYQQIESADTEIQRQAARGFLLLAYTGARPSEIFAATYEQIDKRGAEWTLVLKASKTSRKTGKAREIPLVGPARDLLDPVRASDSSTGSTGRRTGHRMARRR